jgi:hypothetical protein
MLVKTPHHFPDGGGCQLGVGDLELFVEVFCLGELRRIHLLRQFDIPMEPFEAGAALCQRVPAALEASIVRHGDGLSDHVEVSGSIDIMPTLVGRCLRVEE